jgi:tRNA(Ile)-lysidine synthase
MDAATVEAVFAELDRLVPAPSLGKPCLGVAVSGGGDSTALLILARRWADARGATIAAATVDHGLREESAAEARAVATLCARLDVPHQTLRADKLTGAGGNLSAAAREARFALLSDWARANEFSAVLLGHTIDDQAETVLMRLARGSGAEGLSAMQAGVRRLGVLWLRPMLGVRRAALRDLLRVEAVDWIEDPSNEDTRFDRVKARHALAHLAPLGIDADGLARTALHLQRQRRVLERAMDDLARRARRWGPLGEVWLDVAAMAEDEPDTGLRLLADSLVRVSGAPYRPRFRALSGVYEALLAGSAVQTTLSGCLIRPDAGPDTCTVLICREPGACGPSQPLTGRQTVWDHRWRVEVSGAWPASARLGDLGEAGLTALRARTISDVWTPSDAWASAPRAVRLTTPAIWLENTGKSPVLVAAPLAGFLDSRQIGPECAVLAENTAVGELLSPHPPT